MIPFALPRRLVSVLAEETTLFASVIKWTTLASAVGVLAGTATAGFLAVLNWAIGEMQRAPLGHRSMYPSQILGIAKTRSVRVPAGADVGSLKEIRIRPSFRRLRLLLRAFRRLARRRSPSKL